MIRKCCVSCMVILWMFGCVSCLSLTLSLLLSLSYSQTPTHTQVLAMPNNVAEPFVKELQHTSKLLIDLSADYRFDKTWTYGLPERRGERDKILGAKLVSNPGCYATGAQIALMPLADMGVLKTAQIFGVSGYSGAGTNPSDKNDLKYLTDNIVRVFFHLSVVSLKLKTPTPTTGTLRSRESHSRT